MLSVQPGLIASPLSGTSVEPHAYGAQPLLPAISSIGSAILWRRVASPFAPPTVALEVRPIRLLLADLVEFDLDCVVGVDQAGVALVFDDLTRLLLM